MMPAKASSDAPQILPADGIDAVEVFVRGNYADVLRRDADRITGCGALCVDGIDGILRSCAS